MAVTSRMLWLGGAVLAAAIGIMSLLHAETRISPPTSPAHPMDGLTADEVRAAIDVLRGAGRFDAAARVVSMTIDENAKDEVRAWRPGLPFARRALATLLANGQLYEARVDLEARSLAGWDEIKDRQSALTIDELMAASELPKRDQRWIAAMAKRGITDFRNVICLPLTVGPVVDPALSGRRLLNVPCV